MSYDQLREAIHKQIEIEIGRVLKLGIRKLNVMRCAYGINLLPEDGDATEYIQAELDYCGRVHLPAGPVRIRSIETPYDPDIESVIIFGEPGEQQAKVIRKARCNMDLSTTMRTDLT